MKIQLHNINGDNRCAEFRNVLSYSNISYYYINSMVSHDLSTNDFTISISHMNLAVKNKICLLIEETYDDN